MNKISRVGKVESHSRVLLVIAALKKSTDYSEQTQELANSQSYQPQST